MTPEERTQILIDARFIVDAACAKYPHLISRPVPPSIRPTRAEITKALHEMEVGEIIKFAAFESINVRTAVHFANCEESETRWTTQRIGNESIEVRRSLKPLTDTK